MRTTTVRRLGAGLAGLAVITGGALAIQTHEAPAAHATVDSITISGSNWTVGQTYTLSADLSGASFGLLVYWEDNGNPITSPASKVPWPPYHSSTDWTPNSPGQHVITLSQGSSTKSLVVNVSTVATTTTAPPTTTTTVPPTTTTTVPPTTTTTVPPTTTTTDPTTTTPPTTTAPPSTTTPAPSGGGTGSANGLPFGL
ncbi:hypothetical protein ACWEOI_11445 [Nocardia sp. NPDC004340]